MALRKLGLWCGVIGPILWLALIAIAGAQRPDFNHVSHYISELGERGSSTEGLMRYAAFGFTGLLYLCFAAALPATLQDGWLAKAASALIALEGIGRIGAGVFPCDAGCAPSVSGPDLHRLFATVGFCSGVLATFFWGFVLRRSPVLASFSVACGAIALVALVLMSSPDPAWPRGLLEHLATVALSVWLLVLAGRLVWIEKA